VESSLLARRLREPAEVPAPWPEPAGAT
jgi:hypothetical protein